MEIKKPVEDAEMFERNVNPYEYIQIRANVLLKLGVVTMNDNLYKNQCQIELFQ